MASEITLKKKTIEKRTRWWTELAGWGIWSLMQPLCMSLNIRSVKEEHDDVYKQPFIAALWHNRIAVPAYAYTLTQNSLKVNVLSSASKDGALVEAVCARFGMGAIRGSSGRRGAVAFVEMLRKMREGKSCICITPDGPKGPVYKVHPGVIKLASETGVPIVPVCIEYKNCWRIKKAWDKFPIPKPCSDVTLLWRNRIFVPPNLSAEDLETYTHLLEEALQLGQPDLPPITESFLCKSSMENK